MDAVVLQITAAAGEFTEQAAPIIGLGIGIGVLLWGAPKLFGLLKKTAK